MQKKKLQEEKSRGSTDALGRAEKVERCNEEKGGLGGAMRREQILGVGRSQLVDWHKIKR